MQPTLTASRVVKRSDFENPDTGTAKSSNVWPPWLCTFRGALLCVNDKLQILAASAVPPSQLKKPIDRRKPSRGKPVDGVRTSGSALAKLNVEGRKPMRSRGWDQEGCHDPNGGQAPPAT